MQNYKENAFQPGIYLFKVAMETSEKCVILVLSYQKRQQWRRRSGVLIVNFEKTSPIVLVFPLLTLNK